MALTNAERQRRYRERRKARQPQARVRRPRDRRSRPQRWQDAVRTLPDSLRESALADKLEAICDLDLDELDGVEPPLGYGRD